MAKTQTRERRIATHAARPAKVKDVEALVSLLGRGSAAILTDFRGLNVAELADLRAIERAGAEFRSSRTRCCSGRLKASVSRIWAPCWRSDRDCVSRADPSVPAKICWSTSGRCASWRSKGGWWRGCSDPRRSRFWPICRRGRSCCQGARSMAAPLTGLAGVLSALPRNLVYALDQIRKRQEQAAA